MSLRSWQKPIGIVLLLGVLLLGVWLAFVSVRQEKPQQPLAIGIIQYLKVVDPAVEGFKQALEKLGYEEGEDVIYRYESADGSIEKVSAIARQYVAQDVDLIYAVTSVSGREALKATRELGREDIPIVFAHADHPVETGLAQSMASSGNNTTGVAVDLAFLTAKRLEFLKKIRPDIKKVGVFASVYTDPAATFAFEELQAQASVFGIEVVEYLLSAAPGSSSVQELATLADAIQEGDIDALFQIPGPVANAPEQNIETLVALAKRLRIPSTSNAIPHAEKGFLYSYGHDFFAIGKQCARIADKIFNGAKPADIPLEVPESHILALNLRTAREIGVTIPQSISELATIKVE